MFLYFMTYFVDLKKMLNWQPADTIQMVNCVIYFYASSLLCN